MSSPRAVPWLALALASCASNPIPPGEGQGLIASDPNPPAGVTTYERPTWSVGDRFVFRRGGQLRLEYTVADATDDGYVLHEATTDVRVHLDRDLGQLSQDAAGTEILTRVLAPVDPQFSWPLWVGKQWNGTFLRKAPGVALPLLVHYRCDAVETIVVPAGTFEALRIWRRIRLMAEGTFLDQHELVWYVPEVGYFVRRLVDNTLTELEEFHRQ